MIHKKLPHIFLILGVGLTLLSQVHAQSEYASDTVQLQTSRLEQSARESGRQVSIISAAEIQQLPVQTLDELLRYVSGVEVQARGPFGAQADILMRGSTFGQVLMLIDGMRINDPLTGHFNGYLPVTLGEISRIEVLRGPAAALYGADAVGGVIHIITKTFDLQSPPVATHTQGQAGLGQYGLSTAQAGFFAQNDWGALGGGLASNRANGQLLPPDSLGLRNDVETYSASLSGRIRLGQDWQLMARAAVDQRLFNARYFYTRSTFDQSREQIRQGWAQARLAHRGQRSQTYLDVAYKAMEDSFLFNPAFPANLHTTQLLNTQLHHQRQLSQRLQVVGGLQASRRSIVSTDRGDHQDAHGAAYAMAFWQPVRGLSLTGSLRGDFDTNYGFELLPQLNVSYLVGDDFINLRASTGRSIRAADYTERFIGWELGGPIAPGRNLGNPDLVAETAWSHEAGLDLYLFPGLSFSTTGFYRRGTNLIDYLLTPGREYAQPEKVLPDSLYFLTQNLSQLDTYGAEAELNWVKFWDQDLGFRLHLGGTWVQSSNEQDLPSKYLANHAQWVLNGRASLFLNRFTLSLTGLYKNRDAERAAAIGVDLDPNYFVANLDASLRLTPQVSVFTQVINLTDTEYQDILGAYMPRRWVLGGLKWNLGGSNH